jgi:hypothetical protein
VIENGLFRISDLNGLDGIEHLGEETDQRACGSAARFSIFLDAGAHQVIQQNDDQERQENRQGQAQVDLGQDPESGQRKKQQAKHVSGSGQEFGDFGDVIAEAIDGFSDRFGQCLGTRSPEDLAEQVFANLSRAGLLKRGIDDDRGKIHTQSRQEDPGQQGQNSPEIKPGGGIFAQTIENSLGQQTRKERAQAKQDP